MSRFYCPICNQIIWEGLSSGTNPCEHTVFWGESEEDTFSFKNNEWLGKYQSFRDNFTMDDDVELLDEDRSLEDERRYLYFLKNSLKLFALKENLPYLNHYEYFEGSPVGVFFVFAP